MASLTNLEARVAALEAAAAPKPLSAADEVLAEVDKRFEEYKKESMRLLLRGQTPNTFEFCTPHAPANKRPPPGSSPAFEPGCR